MSCGCGLGKEAQEPLFRGEERVVQAPEFGDMESVCLGHRCVHGEHRALQGIADPRKREGLEKRCESWRPSHDEDLVVGGIERWEERRWRMGRECEDRWRFRSPCVWRMNRVQAAPES